MNGNPSQGVLYILVCGSPIARDVGVLVSMAKQEGWEVCVITTPDGRKFVDVPTLQAQTGHPVRTYYKGPGDPDMLPQADAMIVAPATVNTVNKWAAGITDTLVLGLLVEGYGYGVPTAVVPYTNKVMALHPVLHESLARLRDWGVHVLYGEDVCSLGKPGQTDRHRAQFPWRRALQAVSDPVSMSSRVEPDAVS
ncbi:flavoprotein [Actinoplanes sp. TBRC 11911]|uniref:flavoprotein n=1 Tax=Actinoplanes sp. TBRC 11911 TaxID=2729386 RepID=UPI00145D0CDE|nr:flavoprotein [Actinoplanes sp. TBRC 11911]NMO52983.1 flavoprotein [Actinoplanes sp. TBRC 11911]